MSGSATQLDLPAMPPEVTPLPHVLRGHVGLVSPAELGTAIGVSQQTLAGWRSSGQGPSYVKLGKGVFYRLADIQSWVAHRVTEVVVGS